MSDYDSAPKMSIAERIAALQKPGNDIAPPPLAKPKAKKSNALADRIAALQKSAESTSASDEGGSKEVKPKVGKLKLPSGAVPIMSFGAGPPPSLMKKQKEREERMAKLQQEAKSTGDEEEANPGADKPKVGKLKLPAGAIPIMSFGAGPPPSLLKKQKEREERMQKLQQEAASSSESADMNAEDALLSRPTMKGKRRPRTRA